VFVTILEFFITTDQSVLQIFYNLIDIDTTCLYFENITLYEDALFELYKLLKFDLFSTISIARK